MACIRKLVRDITFDCANLDFPGGMGEIDEAIIINSSDISTISETGGVGTITMLTGKKKRIRSYLRKQLCDVSGCN